MANNNEFMDIYNILDLIQCYEYISYEEENGYFDDYDYMTEVINNLEYYFKIYEKKHVETSLYYKEFNIVDFCEENCCYNTLDLFYQINLEG